MTNSDWYLKKLRSPHWQRKRLLVMDRDKFACTRCSETEKELHVHHLDYKYGKDPWDYPLENFKTLCCDCHKEESQLRKVIAGKTLKALREDQFLVLGLLDAAYEDAILHEYRCESLHRINGLVEQGADWDSEGRYYSLDGRNYDEDGNLM